MRKSVLFALLCGVLPGWSEAQWQTVAPGGDTRCSDGSAYRFFVHAGDPAKLLVEFEGGGACWSGATCELDIYTKRISQDPESARQQGLLQGIYDRANAENPVRDYTHVYIPYCTGDLHWGNRTQSYRGLLGNSYSIEHKGATNAAAALNWAGANVANPSQVLVAGCSAGGYGATLWSAQIARRYSGATLRHLSDSAAGVVTPGFFETLLPTWGVGDVWPSFIPGLDLSRLDPKALALPDLYAGIAGFYPLAGFSQFNTRADTTQTFFYALSKGTLGANDSAEWTAGMTASIDRIEAQNPNFDSFTAGGSQHCVINQANFYTMTAGGRRVVDWVKALVTTGAPGTVR